MINPGYGLGCHECPRWDSCILKLDGRFYGYGKDEFEKLFFAIYIFACISIRLESDGR